MSGRYKHIPGMNDILPEQTPLWQQLEAHCRAVFSNYGYQEIRMPLLERTELFARSIGDVTDIVEKEMYTFTDRDGDSLTMRPEGTASCVRSFVEHNLLRQGIHRLWYQGPMFRHERQQKGRYRQFHQFGVELFGIDAPEAEAEIMAMTARLWKQLGLNELTLEINTIGSPASRSRYRDVLLAYFERHRDQLDEDSIKRLERNPLRILDSKNPDMLEVIEQAPQLPEYVDDDSRKHFEKVCAYLQHAGIPFEVNPRLVRGLDYYNGTVFEWTTDKLGAQNAVCSGGRYDGLVEQLGGASTPAVGFALGQERLILLMEMLESRPQFDVDIYLIMVGEQTPVAGLKLAESLRDHLPRLRLIYHLGGGSFKSQMKKADRSGATMAFILGENEVKEQVVAVKYLREDRPQDKVAMTELIPYIARYFDKQRQE